MMTIQTVSANLIAVCFVGGFFIGLGWAIAHWVVDRTLGRLP